MDLAYFIPGSSGNNWGGKRIDFEGKCMNSPCKYHKLIDPSEEWSKSYTWGVCMSQRQNLLNLPVSNLSHRVASQLNNILNYHWAMGLFTCFLSEPKLRYPCPNREAQTSSLWEHSFDHTVPIFTHPRKTILCYDRSYSNAHTHAHKYFRPRETPVSV